MAGAPYLGGGQIRRMLPMEHAVMALEAAFRAGPPAPDPGGARTVLPGGHLILSTATHGPWTAARLTTTPQPATPSDPPTPHPATATPHPGTAPLHSGTATPHPATAAAHPGADSGETALRSSAAGVLAASHTGADGGADVLFVLLDARDLRPRLLLDAGALAVLRAAAAGALATRHLARADARRVVVFGTGEHARAHVEAVLAVRQPDEVRIVAPDAQRAHRLAAELTAQHAARILPGRPEDAAEADIVCVCTPGPLPATALPAAALPGPGSHVTTLGQGLPCPPGRHPYVVGEHAGVPGCDTDLHRVLTGQGSPPPGATTLFAPSGLLATDLALAAELAAKLLS
ncbi:hypothetical protein MF672_020175 [Actinomadura sp. ATCC 31491]|uniref:Ornithine cyclodeaminase family protein n=1 Tax=Actinomadura luzonensis TaxID=2805427 RepID=A0ABT0FUT0_9ACTN|nr:NAD(P)-dependent oxidoreductase [Actinomadura luzonensis]MCK2216098.1 hypothetical protein [Actinomadura luzonensis]